MGLINYILPFLLLITVVVFIHEYGHYYFAKKYGVGVTDFSIGFGKEIFGWNDKSGTRWKFCWIPLGGYVKFFGDRNVFSQSEQQELINKYSEEDRKKLFVIKPLYQRSIIVAAGPMANFLLAILIFTIMNMSIGKDLTPAIISEVQENGPAYTAGIKKNDRIISIDNNKVKSITEVSTLINVSTSDTINFKLLRNDQEIEISVEPNTIETKDSLGNLISKKVVGIIFSNYQLKREKMNFFNSFYYASKEVWFVSITSLKYLKDKVISSGDFSQLGGPVRIAKITGQMAEHGIIPFINIMAYISISLGLINLFPIPMLDGGHLLFYFFEKILGRPLSQKTQESFFRIGMILLFSLMFFVTFNDFKHIGWF